MRGKKMFVVNFEYFAKFTKLTHNSFKKVDIIYLINKLICAMYPAQMKRRVKMDIEKYDNNISVHNEFLIYQANDEKIKIEVYIMNETIWLTQAKIAELFGVNSQAITKHLKNIYAEEELQKDSTCSKLEQVQKEGTRNVTRNLEFYNLDAIIAVGYRVNSKRATMFRIWATKVLKEYIIKGFAMDDERLKNPSNVFGKDYFDEQLERIKDIRTSERRLYQKITDIFESTSIDYKADSEEAYLFFKIVQNKLHYAITKKTAAELIFERVDANKNHMGLTSWKNSPKGRILKYDVTIAKNYLNNEEISKLNNLTNLFLDIAEDEAKEQRVITMQNWIDITDDLLKYRKKDVLKSAGKISHEKAVEKANTEYEKFRIKQDQNYISTMDELYQRYLEESEK